MKKVKSLISIGLAIIMLMTSTVSVYAYDATVPDAGDSGVSGKGSLWGSGIMMKAFFYEPSSYGVNKDNFKTKADVTGLGEFNSLASRSIFEAGMKPCTLPSYTSGGEDSKELAQMYSGKNSAGYTPIQLLIDASNRYTTEASTGHKNIPAAIVSGVGSNSKMYNSSTGIFSPNNVIVKELLAITDNGKNYDSKTAEVNSKIDEMWTKYVKGSSPDMVTYRKQLASLFSGGAEVQNMEEAMNYVASVFREQIAEGKTPTGSSFKIETKAQAARIQEMIMIGIAMTFANPASGLQINGTVVGISESYKGETILSNLKRWVTAGGNSDSSAYQFAFKFETYGSKSKSMSKLYFRWDMSMLAATNQAQLSLMGVTPGYTKGPKNIDYYGYDLDYELEKSYLFSNQYVQGIIDAHKSKGARITRKADSIWSDHYTFFQQAALNTSGVVWKGVAGSSPPSGTPSGTNIRGLLEFKTLAYFNETKTMNTGFTYLAPQSEFIASASGVASKPNPKMEATVKSEVTEIPAGEKAKASSNIDLRFPAQLSADIIKSLNLKVDGTNWASPTGEVQSLLELIDRTKDSSQIAGGSENSKLPVEVTIKRSIENGSGGDGKMLDDTLAGSTQVQKCSHGFTVVSDNGSTAVIKFNIIPDSGNCSFKEYSITSRRLQAAGKTGPNAIAKINNCAVATIFSEASSLIKFNDTDIGVTDAEGGITTVNYDYSYTIKTPTFKENLKAYGDATADKMRTVGTYVGKGYSIKPNGGATYPTTDWVSGYTYSDVIRRSIKFKRAPKAPSYTNFGYEQKKPYFSEIKQGGPTNESFEAMAGTPTTRDLYMSVGATDFRVDFKAPKDATVNPDTYRTYTYRVNVSNCWELNKKCTTSCPGHNFGWHGMDGKDPCTHWQFPPGASCKQGTAPDCEWFTGSGCVCSNTINQAHPDSHTFTYSVKVPIQSFAYFDMTDSEVWRLTDWGLNGGNPFLRSPNPKYTLGTKFWGFNQRNYSSGNGRIMFSANQGGNNEGDLATWGDNTKDFYVSDNLRKVLTQEGLDQVNPAKGSETAFKGTVISDYIVLQTSEGYQVPYFFTQETNNEVSVSEAPDFTGEGGSATVTKLTFDKKLTTNDLWWDNGDSLTCASKDNGWHNTSITYGGYNGDYPNLGQKYINDSHKGFINGENPLETSLAGYGVDVDGQPNQLKDGSGTNNFGQDAGNEEHIIEGLDVIDTTPNGEYNTGKAYLNYKRTMFYRSNSNSGASSGTSGVFEMTGAGLYSNQNIPYYQGAEKINDIVIHDPVSAEDAIVITNDKKFDDRTNAKLMQGGDPPGLLTGICPTIGCQFSTLTCKDHLSTHDPDKCYSKIEDVAMHVGGNNTHEHTSSCYHTHNASCYHVHNASCYTASTAGYSHIHCVSGCRNFEMYCPGAGCTSTSPLAETDGYHPTPNPAGKLTCTKGTGLICGYTSLTNTAGWKHVGSGTGSYTCGGTCGSYHVGMSHTYGGVTYACMCKCPSTCHSGSCPAGTSTANRCDNPAAHAIPNLITCTGDVNTCSYCKSNTVFNNGKYPFNIPACTNVPNKHVCTKACTFTYKKMLNCTNPHHYEPGEPTNIKSPKYHYPLGDPRCWTRCGNDAKHGQPPIVDLPDGTTANLGGTFINLDREFKIYFPFVGDFAEDPSLEGIDSTTGTNGKGYENDMNTKEWTSHRWVRFPVNVIDPLGKMVLAYTQIDLNNYSTDNEFFTFYCVLSNDEMAQAEVKFTATAINAPVDDRDAYFDESDAETNKERVDEVYAARHTGHKFQSIDVVGYIGALTLNDTGDFRFSNLFKQSKKDGTWLIPNLVPEVFLNIPNHIVGDKMTVRRDESVKGNQWLNTYGLMYNDAGGKSGGKDALKQPLAFPLVPRYNNIPALRNQPMRPGYQLYLDNETVGNYYGETTPDTADSFLDAQMVAKQQVRPIYYSLDMDTGVYTPVDVYYGINGEYMQVNDYDYGGSTDEVGVRDYYYYLDWLNEASRRNNTKAENNSTEDVKEYRKNKVYSSPTLRLRSPSAEKDVIGSANVLFLNDLNRTFIGSSKTYGADKNPGKLLQEASYNEQSQRWNYTIGLPSSSVFVESNQPCTEANIAKLQTVNRVIVCTLDIKTQGDVWTLQYNGKAINSIGFQIYEGGKTFDPPKFDDKGNPTTDPNKDVTSEDPIIVIYPPNKTSKDDVKSGGIQ